MGAWVDFLEVALALGMGWLGLVLWIVMRSAGRNGLGHGPGHAARPGPWLAPRERVAQVVNLPARDGDR